MPYKINVLEFENISQIYCTLTEECANAVSTLYEEMEENTRKCQYKPLMDFTNQICRFYYGDFKSHVFRHFQNWQDSPHSLDNLTKNIGAGEEAAAEGRRYMERIHESLEEMFNRASLEEIRIDVSQPNIDNDTIMRNTEYIKQFLGKAESATQDALNTVKGHMDENDAYISIQGVVSTLGNSISESFRSMISQVEHGESLFDHGAFRFADSGESDTGSIMEAADSVIFESWGDV